MCRSARSVSEPLENEEGEARHEVGEQARGEVVGEDAPGAGQALELADRRGLPNIEEAERKEAGDENNGDKRQADEGQEHATEFIEDDFVRIGRAAEPLGDRDEPQAGGQSPNEDAPPPEG